MKKIFIASLLTLFAASPAWSLLLSDDTDVGDLDTLVDFGDKLSGIGAETTWVTDKLRTYLEDDTLTFDLQTVYDSLSLPYQPDNSDDYGKVEDVYWYYVYETDGTTIVPDAHAFWLGSPQTDFFLVKNATQVALFENNAELDWGVFKSTGLDLNLGDGYSISHVTRFTGGPAPVPEPSTVLLMGLGLAGLVGYSRKRNKR